MVRRCGKLVLKWLLRADLAGTYRSQRFRRTNERPVEYSFAFRALNDFQPEKVLDVGTGRSAFPALLRNCGFVVTAVDNIRDYWPGGMSNPHWHVIDDDIVRTQLPEATFDAVTCVSVLEHVTLPLDAVRSMRRLLKPGGALILTTPFGAIGHPNVYNVPGSYGARNRYPCRQSSPEDLGQWLQLGFQLKCAEYWSFFHDSEYWSCGTLKRPPQQTTQPAHLGCFTLVKDSAEIHDA